MHYKNRTLNQGRHAWFLLLALYLLCTAPAWAIDEDNDGIDDDHEDSLLQRFAPIVKIHSDESNKPASVDWTLPKSRMRYNHDNCPDSQLLNYGQVNAASITEQSQDDVNFACIESGQRRYSNMDEPPEDLSSGFFLQYLDTAHPGSPSSEWTVYGHVYPGTAGRKVVQYWFFYPYNHAYGTFNHEGDWETIAVVLDGTEEAEHYIYFGHGDPHYFSAQGTPGATAPVTVGDHPIVYSARGSHASYISHTGEVCDGSPNILLDPLDHCNDAGDEWRTWEFSFGGIVNVGERFSPRSGFNWLRYSGLWGEVGAWPEIPAFRHTSGPRGPAYQWAAWHVDGSEELCGNGIDDDIDGEPDEGFCTSYPDLAMTESNPALGPNGHGGWITIEPGETFPVRCALDNLGTGFTEFFDVEFVLSADEERDASDFPLLGCLNLEGMAAATSYAAIPTWDVTAPLSIPPGEYFVIATADGSNAIYEGFDGEDNNSRVSQMKVTVLGSSGQQQLNAGESSTLMQIHDNFSDFQAQDFSPDRGTWDASVGSYIGRALNADRDDAVSLVTTLAPRIRMEFDFSVHIEGANGSYLGAVLRYDDPNNFLRIDIRKISSTTWLRLLDSDAGAETELASIQLPRGVSEGLHHLKIDDTGCHVTVELNGETFLDTDYTSEAPVGQRGLFTNRNNSILFDNFLLTELAEVDNDGDGWSVCQGDCNDSAAAIHPGHSEVCGNSTDDDCDGVNNEGCRRIRVRPRVDVEDGGE